MKNNEHYSNEFIRLTSMKMNHLQLKKQQKVIKTVKDMHVMMNLLELEFMKVLNEEYFLK